MNCGNESEGGKAAELGVCPALQHLNDNKSLIIIQTLTTQKTREFTIDALGYLFSRLAGGLADEITEALFAEHYAIAIK